MRIVLAGDHAGFTLKTAVAKHLVDSGHDVLDLGTDSEEPVDYPPFCADAARAVVRGEADFAILFGGSGQGEQIAANKVHGARAALCQSEFMTRLAREHNDANVLALGGRVLGEPFALAIVDAFLSTTFEGGRHERRIAQVAEIEREECEKL
ncbi:MAG: ribose 5-phosphate isomerase B [Actinomycetota bacterium]